VEKPYLGLANYTANLRRLGWTDEDLSGGGSDALIDALAPTAAPRRWRSVSPGTSTRGPTT
jgi:hypothetical protein